MKILGTWTLIKCLYKNFLYKIPELVHIIMDYLMDKIIRYLIISNQDPIILLITGI